MLKETLLRKGAVAVATGPVASGKTALLQALARRTAQDGGTFLSATGSRAEQSLPLGLVSQLFCSADVPPGDLDQVQSALDGTLAETLYEHESSGAEHLERTGESAGVPAALLSRLSKVFFDLAANGPVVIGVDDAHYADLASLLVLRYL